MGECNDRSGLILPGSIPLDAPRVREELLRYSARWLERCCGQRCRWSPGAAPSRAIDAENSRFGALSAARRVARAIFMGSAPHVRQQTARGIEDGRVRLGVVQPGESVATFNDATGRTSESIDPSVHQCGPLLV